jgi:GNAT superfamily N-acetyltransferase
MRGDHFPQDRLTVAETPTVGSIQAFPRKPAVANLADVWRAASLPSSGNVEVREMRLEDYAALRALQREAAPWLAVPTLRQVESRRHAFAEGQLVAQWDGRLVGVVASLVVPWDHRPEAIHASLTGEGFFTTHDAAAGTLYLAEMFVEGGRRSSAIARALFQAGRRLCRRRNLRRMATATRLEGHDPGLGSDSPERHAMRVVWGDTPDAAMRLPMSLGFQYCGILRDFFPEDSGSGGHAALFAWLNPTYAPPRPPACALSERPRKCA